MLFKTGRVVLRPDGAYGTLAGSAPVVLPIVEAPRQDGDQAQGDQHFGNIEGAHKHSPDFDYTAAWMQSLYWGVVILYLQAA
jgi:hypothetical protein